MYSSKYTTISNPNTNESYIVELIDTIRDGKKIVWVGKVDGVKQRFYSQDGWRTAATQKTVKHDGNRFAVTTASTINATTATRQTNYNAVANSNFLYA